MAENTDKITINKTNPFEWGVREECKFISIPTQRNATYNEPAKEVFTGSEVTSFYFNGQAPTPQIKHVCGIECPNAEGCAGNDPEPEP